MSVEVSNEIQIFDAKTGEQVSIEHIQDGQEYVIKGIACCSRKSETTFTSIFYLKDMSIDNIIEADINTVCDANKPGLYTEVEITATLFKINGYPKQIESNLLCEIIDIARVKNIRIKHSVKS